MIHLGGVEGVAFPEMIHVAPMFAAYHFHANCFALTCTSSYLKPLHLAYRCPCAVFSLLTIPSVCFMSDLILSLYLLLWIHTMTSAS